MYSVKTANKMYFKFLLLVAAILLPIAFLPDTKPWFGFDIDLTQRRNLSLPSTFSGPLLANNLLSKADKLFVNELWGPESFAVWEGNIYTSLGNGRIVQILPDSIKPISLIDPHDHGPEQCAKLYNSPQCGRPLGLKFDSKGTLYTVDPNFGLFSINVTTGENVLIKKREELDSAIFLDDLVVYEKGNGHTIFYMTDLSHRWEVHDGAAIMAEQEQTGRLLSYDTETGAVKVEVDNLPAPNGVELSDDRTAILMVSFTDRLIYKYWISGAKKGKLEILIENLPGEPDNIHRSANTNRETYWITAFSARNSYSPSKIDKYLSQNGIFLRFVLRLQRSIGFLIESVAIFFQNEVLMDFGFATRAMQFTSPFVCEYGMILEIDGQTGEIVNSLHSPDGTVCSLSEVLELEPTETERRFYLGSAFNPYLGKLSVPKSAFRDFGKEATTTKVNQEKATPPTQKPKTKLNVQEEKAKAPKQPKEATKLPERAKVKNSQKQEL